jgi:TonB family protein
MGVIVLVAVDGTGRVLDAAGGSLNWYVRRGRKWLPATGPYSIEDVLEVERAAVAGASQSRFSLPPGTGRSPTDIYRGQFELRWEISAGKPVTSGPVVMTRGPDHDLGLVRQIDPGDEVAVMELIHKVAPRFPEDARASRASGTVTLDATVDETGKVIAVGVLMNEADAKEFPTMSESAVAAVRQWRYEPARKDGQPVMAHITVTIEFRFEE